MTLPIQQDRLAQLIMKDDPTRGLDVARIRLERAALSISIGPAARTSWGQAALLTLAECAVRSFRGGVYLRGEFEALVRVGNWMPVPLRRMLIDLGCRTEDPPDSALHVHVGADLLPERNVKLRCWTDGWIAVAGPTAPNTKLKLGNEISGALAGAMLVTKAFQLLIFEDAVAGRRTERLSPLTPNSPVPDGIALELLPSSMWLLGLGNLGQAALWILGLLPYEDPGAVELILHDMDKSGPENRDVQILTKPHWFGRKKARMAAEWAEARGFQTTIIETPFSAGTKRTTDQPGLALVGVDNLPTRRLAASEAAGFDLVLDAGLGATSQEVFDMRIHGFPGSRSPSAAWPDIQPETKSDPATLSPDLSTLVSQRRLDKCGAISILDQAVGLPSTAVAAAAIQIAQVCRAIAKRRFCDRINVSLSNTSRSDANEVQFEKARLILFEEARTEAFTEE